MIAGGFFATGYFSLHRLRFDTTQLCFVASAVCFDTTQIRFVASAVCFDTTQIRFVAPATFRYDADTFRCKRGMFRYNANTFRCVKPIVITPILHFVAQLHTLKSLPGSSDSSFQANPSNYKTQHQSFRRHPLVAHHSEYHR